MELSVEEGIKMSWKCNKIAPKLNAFYMSLSRNHMHAFVELFIYIAV